MEQRNRDEIVGGALPFKVDLHFKNFCFVQIPSEAPSCYLLPHSGQGWANLYLPPFPSLNLKRLRTVSKEILREGSYSYKRSKEVSNIETVWEIQREIRLRKGLHKAQGSSKHSGKSKVRLKESS